MRIRTLSNEIQCRVTDLDRESELQIEKTGLATVPETGAGHAYFRFAETGFFFRHPAEDGGWTGAYFAFVAVFFFHHAEVGICAEAVFADGGTVDVFPPDFVDV